MAAKNKIRNKYGRGYAVFTVFNYIFLILLALVMLVPYLHVVAKAFNESADTMKGGIVIWPRKFTLDNFMLLFKDPGLLSAIRVTVSRIGLGLVGGLLVQFMTAYGLSRPNMPFKKAITMYFVIPMYIGGGLIPTYILFSKIHLLNSFWVYVFPMLFVMYNCIIIRSYISSSVPHAVVESAYIDGASEIQCFWKVVLPLCKPIIATVSLWIAVSHWNAWSDSLYYIRSSKLQTLMYKLTQLLKESERFEQMMREAAKSGSIADAAKNRTITQDSVVSAQIVITTLPIIMVYPFLQKYFINGVTVGAVKG